LSVLVLSEMLWPGKDKTVSRNDTRFYSGGVNAEKSGIIMLML
jgi:hypothetical protein